MIVHDPFKSFARSELDSGIFRKRKEWTIKSVLFQAFNYTATRGRQEVCKTPSNKSKMFQPSQDNNKLAIDHTHVWTRAISNSYMFLFFLYVDNNINETLENAGAKQRGLSTTKRDIFFRSVGRTAKHSEVIYGSISESNLIIFASQMRDNCKQCSFFRAAHQPNETSFLRKRNRNG